METMKDYGTASYNSESDGRVIYTCKAAQDQHPEGRGFDCRLTFFTLRLGVLFHWVTHRDVVISGSALLRKLLGHFPRDRFQIVQAVDITPIESILKTKLFDHNWILWTLQYLQFAHDYPKGHPDRRPFPDALAFALSADHGISELIGLCTVATFFGIPHLKAIVISGWNFYHTTLLKNILLVSSEGSTGTAQWMRQANLSSQLQHVADAVERAAPIVPRDSHMWISVARFLLALRQVLDGTDGGEQVRQVIARLNPIAPFAHACVEVSLNIRPASLVGVFRSPVDWNLQCETCACTACANVIFARDLVARTADEIAGGAVQKSALVNPFDGFRTLFCDFCTQRCGVPWAGGNKPCVPHE
ncbi:hypothetical protein KVR01_005572 [Diaporthe batatas]|uniref:uncharacterized protein n=1 Tax=Diaporthe batatas TaxID=748121 RepID=UPI001D054D29|nr:uncharacterized protein KVR01_005572 [Diaporthe batatas]KAG8165297.1 hypothetical protein KVR01_005572 [Diaporthe batatas]